jgi:hypothetical protein
VAFPALVVGLYQETILFKGCLDHEGSHNYSLPHPQAIEKTRFRAHTGTLKIFYNGKIPYKAVSAYSPSRGEISQSNGAVFGESNGCYRPGHLSIGVLQRHRASRKQFQSAHIFEKGVLLLGNKRAKG